MNQTPYIIAVDGPAGAGKSAVCSDVARELGILHLDTGATYRTFALGLLRRGISPEDKAAVESPQKATADAAKANAAQEFTSPWPVYSAQYH